MRPEVGHICEQDLLLAIDGELPESSIKIINEHLAACWDCRSRRAKLEATIARFVEARHEILDAQLPSETGSRALLKARISEFSVGLQDGFWGRLARGLGQSRVVAAGLAAVLIVSVVVLTTVYNGKHVSSDSSGVLAPMEPRRQLTPGAVRQVNLRDICGAPSDENAVRVVSASLQQQVFREYGIEGAGPRDYEVDFLITPELGGSNDIHNLWPEPYYSTVWNAHVKDELEDLLHAKVCDGEIDLRTAQRDISGDWISAYKKYFHTEKPL
jgi:hypothetical protein